MKKFTPFLFAFAVALGVGIGASEVQAMSKLRCVDPICMQQCGGSGSVCQRTCTVACDY